jgi:hypothetical protein
MNRLLYSVILLCTGLAGLGCSGQEHILHPDILYSPSFSNVPEASSTWSRLEDLDNAAPASLERFPYRTYRLVIPDLTRMPDPVLYLEHSVLPEIYVDMDTRLSLPEPDQVPRTVLVHIDPAFSGHILYLVYRVFGLQNPFREIQFSSYKNMLAHVFEKSTILLLTGMIFSIGGILLLVMVLSGILEKQHLAAGSFLVLAGFYLGLQTQVTALLGEMHYQIAQISASLLFILPIAWFHWSDGFFAPRKRRLAIHHLLVVWIIAVPLYCIISQTSLASTISIFGWLLGFTAVMQTVLYNLQKSVGKAGRMAVVYSLLPALIAVVLVWKYPAEYKILSGVLLYGTAVLAASISLFLRKAGRFHSLDMDTSRLLEQNNRIYQEKIRQQLVREANKSRLLDRFMSREETGQDSIAAWSAPLESLNMLFKLDSGIVAMQPEETDVMAVLQECVHFAEQYTRSRNLKLVLEFSPSTPEFIMIDKKMLLTVIKTCLYHCISSSEGGRIWLRSAGNTRRRTMEIQVEDEGKGFPDTWRESIVNPWKHLPANPAVLELAMVRQYCRAADGNLYFFDKQTAGNCLHISLHLSGVREQPDGWSSKLHLPGNRAFRLLLYSLQGAEMALTHLQPLPITVDTVGSLSGLHEELGRHDYELLLLHCEFDELGGILEVISETARHGSFRIMILLRNGREKQLQEAEGIPGVLTVLHSDTPRAVFLEKIIGLLLKT